MAVVAVPGLTAPPPFPQESLWPPTTTYLMSKTTDSYLHYVVLFGPNLSMTGCVKARFAQPFVEDICTAEYIPHCLCSTCLSGSTLPLRTPITLGTSLLAKVLFTVILTVSTSLLLRNSPPSFY